MPDEMKTKIVTAIFYKGQKKKFIKPPLFESLTSDERVSLLMSEVEIHGGVVAVIRINPKNGDTVLYMKRLRL
jgi:hypothetical protein